MKGAPTPRQIAAAFCLGGMAVVVLFAGGVLTPVLVGALLAGATAFLLGRPPALLAVALPWLLALLLRPASDGGVLDSPRWPAVLAGGVALSCAAALVGLRLHAVAVRRNPRR